MDYRQLFKEIDRGEVRPLYLFCGEEKYLQEEALRRLLQKTVEPSRRSFNYHGFSGTGVLASTITETAVSPPFSAPRRLILVRDAEQLPPAQQEKLLPYCQKPSPTSCLVLMAAKKSLIAPLLQEISRRGAVAEFAALSAGEILNWILNKVKEEGCRISPAAARYLSESGGQDLFRVHSELQKAVAYVGEKRSIELSDVQEVSPPSNQASVFDLAAALAEKNLAAALCSLHFLVGRNEPPLVILAMIARHFRQLWQAKSLSERGLAPRDMARELDMPPFRAEKLVSQAGRFSHEKLRTVWTCFLETDKTLKSSALQDKLILEGLLLKLCR